MTLKELMQVTDPYTEIAIAGKPDEVTETVRYACAADVLDDSTTEGLTVVEVSAVAVGIAQGVLWVRVYG